jgi:hypothetical protein
VVSRSGGFLIGTALTQRLGLAGRAAPWLAMIFMAGAESSGSVSPPAAPVAIRAAGGSGPIEISAWIPLFRGIEWLEASAAAPRPLQIRALRVDTRASGIDFLVTPSNGSEPKDVGARGTTELLEEFHCQAAINGSVFDVHAQRRGDPMDILGLSLSRGQRYSPPNRWDALLIGRDRRAWVARAPVDSRKAWNGLSGFHALLVRGKNRGSRDDLHPRSAVGVTRDGSHLLIMTADGRQPGYSEGLTTAETAEWMRRLGAEEALNLDGGGSTTLVIQGRDGKPELLNRPSGPPPGRERRVANHLCVFAQPLPGPR